MAYGYIQTASNVARQLKDFNRDYYGRKTWQHMYDTINLEKEQALQNLSTDYNEQVAQAYKTAYNQKAYINNSMLGSGYKEQQAAEIDSALQQAFNTYRQTYLNSASQIESLALEETSAIDKALNAEAQNYLDYSNSAYSYLQYLYDRAFPGDNADYDAVGSLTQMFNNNANWSKYITTDSVTGEKRLMTQQELMQANYDMDEYGQGSLNTRGIDFYDQMLNELAMQGSAYSFNAWLSKENPKLYEWSISDNQYNYTDARDNMGTFKKMLGLKSTDDQYAFIERFGGISKTEVESTVKSFVDDVKNFNNTGHHKDTKAILNVYSTALNKLTRYVNTLPLPEAEKTKLSSAISSLESNINNVDIANTSEDQAISEVVNFVKKEQPLLGKIAGSIGAFSESLINGLSSMVAPKRVVNGQVVSQSASYLKYKDRETQRKYSNQEIIDDISRQYLDIMTLLASYAK